MKARLGAMGASDTVGDPEPGVPANLVEFDPRPTILVPGCHQTADTSVREVGNDEFVTKAIGAFPKGTVWKQNGQLGYLKGDPGQRMFVAYDNPSLRIDVDSSMRLRSLGTGGQPRALGAATSFVTCSSDHATLIMAGARSAAIPNVDAIVHHPHYTADLCLARPGLDPATGIFYDPAPELEKLPACGAAPLDEFQDLLSDFLFKDSASFYAAVGLMLTLLLRLAVGRQVPIHLATAPEPRLGKTTLVDVIVRAVLGEPVRWMQLGRTEEERQKQIASGIEGNSMLLGYDNLREGDVLDSPALASFVTSVEYQYRVLGKTEVRSRRNRHVVVATGNNVEATEELAKRIVPMNLVMPDEGRRRKFRYKKILEHTDEVRPRILAALHGMVEAWKAAGRPLHQATIPGFETWCEVVGGILDVAGPNTWLSNVPEWLEDATPANADGVELVRGWWGSFGGRPVTATQLLHLVRTAGVFPHVLEPRDVAGQSRSLGRTVLKLMTNRVIDGKRVVRQTSGSSAKYRLAPLDPVKTDDPPVTGKSG